MTEKIVFYGSLAYNVLMNRLNLRKWYDRIDQHVLLGALPLKGKFPKQLIKQENVRAVISMNQDYELNLVSLTYDDWKCLGVEFLQLPTKDFVEVPSLTNLKRGVQMIMNIINESTVSSNNNNNHMNNNETSMPKPSIYVHCKAGRTRSTTLVACYLIRAYNMSPESAVNFIKTKRPHIVLTANHLDVIHKFHDSLERN